MVYIKRGTRLLVNVLEGVVVFVDARPNESTGNLGPVFILLKPPLRGIEADSSLEGVVDVPSLEIQESSVLSYLVR